MSRALKINYDSEGAGREIPGKLPDWLESFAEEMASQKTAVEVARERDSIADQMTNILSGKRSRYSSVAEAVEDYKKRTGLSQYKERAQEQKMQSLASQILDKKKDHKLITRGQEIPELLQKRPDIDAYIRNTIQTNPGSSLAGILLSIPDVFRGIKDSDIDDETLKRHINTLLMHSRIPRDIMDPNIGRGVGIRNEYVGGRDSNREAFTALMPAPKFY